MPRADSTNVKPSVPHRVFGRIQKTSLWFDSRFTAAGRILVLSLTVSTIYALDPRQTSAYQLTAALSAALLVAFVFSFKRAKQIEIQRVLPSFFTRGETGDYLIHVNNKGSQEITNLSLRDQLCSGPNVNANDAALAPPATLGWLERKMGFLPWLNAQRFRLGARVSPSDVHHLPGRGMVTVKQTITPLRRGVMYFSGTDTRQTETLGLMRSVRHHKLADKALILPPRIELPKVAWQSQRLFHRGGISVASTVGDSQEFIGLRDYRAGDPLRQIHWRSFAKLGRPIVKEYQDEYFDHHALVLDRSILSGQEALFEVAASVAVSFVQLRQPNDSLLDLVLVGDFSWRATAGRGSNDKARLLEHLAVVMPTVLEGHDRTDSENFDRQLQQLMNCNSVVFITCHWDTYCHKGVAKLRRAGLDVLGLCIGEEQRTFFDHHQLDAVHIAQQLPTLLKSLGDGNN